MRRLSRTTDDRSESYFAAGLAAAAARHWTKARKAFVHAIRSGDREAVWAGQELVQSYLADADQGGAEQWILTWLAPGGLRDHLLGYLFRRSGRRPEATKLFERAFVGRPRIWAAASELGFILCQLGESARGLALLRQAERHFRRHGDEWGLSITLSLQATRAIETLSLSAAERGFREALDLKRRCGDAVGEGAVLHNLGLAWYHLADYDRARDSLEQALAIQRGRADLRGMAFSLNTLGLVELDLVELSRAADRFRESARLFRRIGEFRGEGSALTNLAEARRLRGEHAVAARWLSTALQIERRYGSVDSCGTTVANLAACLVAQGRPDSALVALNTLAPKSLRRATWRTRAMLYRERARTLLAVGEPAAAARAIRRALARVSGQQRTELVALEARTLAVEILLARGQAKRAADVIADLAREVETLLARHRVAGTRIGLLETNRRVHDLWLEALASDRENNLGKGWSVAAGVKSRELQTRGARRMRSPLRSKADPCEILLEYYVSPATTWLFARACGRSLWVDLRLPERRLANAIHRLIEPLRAAGASADPGVDLGRYDTDLAARLADRLLAPAFSMVAELPPRVVIVPHGPLHGLAFELLLATQLGDVVDRRGVVYAPSSLIDWRPIHGHRQHFLGIAWSPTNDRRSQHDAAPLPAAECEIEVIGSLYRKSTLLLGEKATTPAFVRDAPSASVIHVAAHAMADLVEPARSSILLAAADSAAGASLSAREIARLRLASPLVVLSACDSHVGRLRAHEGTQGLARAFLDAGAAAVVASLWRVDDEATQRLMTEFHRRLAAGEGRIEALALAKASIRSHQASSHPYYWAAFVLIDRNPRAVSDSTSSP